MECAQNGRPGAHAQEHRTQNSGSNTHFLPCDTAVTHKQLRQKLNTQCAGFSREEEVETAMSSMHCLVPAHYNMLQSDGQLPNHRVLT